MRRDLNSPLIETNTGRCVGRREVFEATCRSDQPLCGMISWSAAKAARKVMLGITARHTCPRLSALRRKLDPPAETMATPSRSLAGWCCLLCWRGEGRVGAGGGGGGANRGLDWFISSGFVSIAVVIATDRRSGRPEENQIGMGVYLEQHWEPFAIINVYFIGTAKTQRRKGIQNMFCCCYVIVVSFVFSFF